MDTAVVRSFILVDASFMKILLVSDSLERRVLLRLQIESMSGECYMTESDSVYKTLMALVVDEPEMLVIDLHMRNSSGFQILGYLAGMVDPPLIFGISADKNTYNRAHSILPYIPILNPHFIASIPREPYRCQEQISSGNQTERNIYA